MGPGIQYNGEWYNVDADGIVRAKALIEDQGLPVFIPVWVDEVVLELFVTESVPLVIRHGPDYEV